MLAHVLITVSDVYSGIIFIYVMLSWFPHSNGIVGDVYYFLGRLCDPFLNLFKKLIPPIGGMVDITPIIALLVLQFGVRLIVSLF